MQEADALELEGYEGVLMESWPDDPEEGVLVSALRTMPPPHFDSDLIFLDESYLMKRGDRCRGFFRIEKGTVEIECFEDEDAESDVERAQVGPLQCT